MDGTLVDSEKIYLKGFQQAFNKNGFDVDGDFVKVFSGMSGEEEMLEIDKITRDRAVTNKIFQEMLDYVHSEFDHVELKTGAVALLEHCQNYHLKIGLATSTHEASARATLEKFGLLSYFDFFVFGNEVAVPKPDPMIYRLATAKSEFRPEHCLVVEDSFSGVTAATKAKLSVVQIIDDVPPVDLADYHVGALNEVHSIIDKLRSKNHTIQSLLLNHQARYPKSQPQDFLKLLYQNEFGCGHLITDPEKNKQMLVEELMQIAKNENTDAVESIGSNLCRLHLRILYQTPLSIGTFQRFFEISAKQLRGSTSGYLEKGALLKELCNSGELPFPSEEISKHMIKWQHEGCRPFRHSEAFREAYSPAYRVIDKKFCVLLSLFCQIDELMKADAPIIVAIDGDSAAGKTTLAALLKEVYDCNVIHMDHFFLRPEQRTDSRLKEAGGNIDYERFANDVLPHLRSTNRFSYRPYNCMKQEFEDEITIEPRKLTIVEGAYSQHPLFANTYHLKVFLSLPRKEQAARILQRNGEAMSRKFQDIWIPLEKQYFAAFNIADQSDLQFDFLK